jgi:hypothetical protein
VLVRTKGSALRGLANIDGECCEDKDRARFSAAKSRTVCDPSSCDT